MQGATLSDCGKFRYRLWRYWDSNGKPPLVFVMLNPSTADAEADDPTIRKCIGFAKRYGYGGIEVLNLYAYRATKPADLKKAGYPVGPDNDRHFEIVADQSGELGSNSNWVFAWGANARGMSRPAEVMERLLIAGIHPRALKLTHDGIPMHPLMLGYDNAPTPIKYPGRATVACVPTAAPKDQQ